MSKNNKTANQGTCPACDSNNLIYGSLEPIGNSQVYYLFNCNNCGASGKEIYDLKNGRTELIGEFAINDIQKWTDKMQTQDDIRADLQ